MRISDYDVLVTGAEERQGLAVLRSLGRRGLRVLACGTHDLAIGYCSRFVHGSASYPSPNRDTLPFARRIAELVTRHNIRVVMPSVESTVIALDAHRDLFPSETILGLPPSSVLAAALDKRRTYQICTRLGIGVPRSCFPGSIDEGLEFASTTGYPVVLKPRAQATYRDAGGDLGFKVRYALDENEMKTSLAAFDSGGVFPILQEYCSGDGVAHSFMVVNREIRGLYQHRRVREYPLTGGVASVIVSEAMDETLLDWTRALIQDVEWDGVAQVEYRHDLESGRRTLIEINGRLWAPLSGSIQLGLDFPFAWYQYLTSGDETTLSSSYAPGKRYRYLRGDLIALEGYLRGDVVEGLRKLPGKLRAVWNVIRDFGPGVNGDIWDWSDRRPAWRESRFLFKRYMTRLLRKLRLVGRR